MKTISILSGRAMIVELPEHEDIEKELGIHGHDEGLTESEFKDDVLGLIPEGNWQIVGRLSEVTEEQAAGIVPQKDFPDFSLNGNPITIRCYDDGTGKFEYTDALESLDSAIRAEGWLFENPHPMPSYVPQTKQAFLAKIKEVELHKDAQSRVLDRSRCLLLRRA